MANEIKSYKINDHEIKFLKLNNNAYEIDIKFARKFNNDTSKMRKLLDKYKDKRVYGIIKKGNLKSMIVARYFDFERINSSKDLYLYLRG